MNSARILAVLAFLGCGSSTPALQEPSAEPASGAEQSEPGAEGAEGESPTAAEHMQHHFAMVTRARDAVIAGKPTDAQAPMGELAAGDYGIEIPEAWMRALYDMQRTAERAAKVSELEAAASGVAEVARQCGDCHRERVAGPDKRGDVLGYYQHEAEENLAQAMARHAWVAEQLWIGLVAPSHEAWIAGAEALTMEWSPPPDQPAGSEFEVGINAVRQLGPRARDAQTPLARQGVYRELIVACGRCHGGG
ncbi:MAG: hypothetical protein OEZ06_10290 [Myxococcales bacterium]|nr:hypothetical protein [Myxococcales bacterium]